MGIKIRVAVLCGNRDVSDAREFCTVISWHPGCHTLLMSAVFHLPRTRRAGDATDVPVTPRRVRNGFAQQALAAEATYSNRDTEREHAAATLDLCTVSASAQARVTTRLQDDSEG